MTGNHTAEDILADVTRVGSKLADLATQQLDMVMTDLSSPAGARQEPNVERRESLGRNDGDALLFHLLQLMGKAGELMAQLSRYDVVRNDTPRVVLRAANPFESLTFPAGARPEYAFMLVNDGRCEPGLTLTATLTGDGTAPRELLPTPELTRIESGEHLRACVQLPELREGTHLLEIRARTDQGQLLAAQNVQLRILPAPRPHSPC